jgi:hypothetical protein
MKNAAAFFVFAVFVLLFSLAAEAGQTLAIQGTVAEFTLSAQDGQSYDIEDSGKGRELVNLGPKLVEVTGSVDEDEWGKIIRVTSYKVLGDVPDPAPEEADMEGAEDGENDAAGKKEGPAAP